LSSVRRIQPVDLRDLAPLVEHHGGATAPQAHEHLPLGRICVAVRPHVTARLHGVEKALNRLFMPVEVMVHPQTRMANRFGGDAVQKSLVDASDV